MTVDVERDGGAALLTFGTGERANALSSRVRHDVLAVLRDVASDDSVRALLVTGRGRDFSAGQDLGEHRALLAEGGADAVARIVRDEFSAIAAALDGLRIPTVAAVGGVAAGAGLGVALACDLRIAGRSARFTTAFAKVGLAPDTGVSVTLPRAVGQARALDLLLRPRLLGSDEALAIGLVHEVVDDDLLEGRAREVVGELAIGPTLAYAQIKALSRTDGDLDAALEREADSQRQAAATSDHTEAVEAFLAKRPAQFTGR